MYVIVLIHEQLTAVNCELTIYFVDILQLLTSPCCLIPQYNTNKKHYDQMTSAANVVSSSSPFINLSPTSICKCNSFFLI